MSKWRVTISDFFDWNKAEKLWPYLRQSDRREFGGSLMRFLIPCLITALVSCSGPAEDKQSFGTAEVATAEWRGAGYYYGIWFDTEEEYLVWIAGHPEYPPNGEYYNPNYPIYYYPEEHHPEVHPAAHPEEYHPEVHPAAHPAEVHPAAHPVERDAYHRP